MTTDDKFDRVVRSRWATVAVLALSFLLYLPSIGNGFSMDDDPIVRSKCNQYPELHGDPMITGHFDESKWEYFVKFFQKHYWWPESYNDGLYRPISVLSYGLTYQAIGRHLEEDNEALPQHALNVMLHVWAVWLVLALLSAVGATRRIALLTALFFGVHAIHSEVVSGIIGRAEMFSFCFGAQAMVWMLRGGWWRHGSAAFFMFLAYGSKEVSLCWIPFFFCLVLARGWLGESGGSMLSPLRRRQSASALVALLLPAMVWFWLRHVGMQSDPLMDTAADFSSNPLAHTSAMERILTGIKVWGYGLWLCFVPVKLSCIYSPHVFEIVDSPANLGFLASLAALLGLLGGGLWCARKQPLLFLAMACFLGFSFITSNVGMAIGTIFGERLYYTPSVGTCLLMALLLPRRGGAARAFLVVVALWCAGNVVVASMRVSDWRSSTTLFLADVKKYPMAIDLHRKVAQSYMNDGPSQDYDKAIEHFETAITLQPNYAHAFRGLGKIYRARREWDDAIAAYKQSYGRGYPDPAGAESIAFNAIGDCYLGRSVDGEPDAFRRQQIATAATWFEKSLAAPLWGDSWGEAINRLGDCQIQLSKLEKSEGGKEQVVRRALQFFLRTIEMRPIDKPSRLAAFERVFQYFFFDKKALLPRETIHQLYLDAHKVVGEDPELTLLMGVAAYKAGLPAMMVLQPLGAAILTFPESERNEDFYTTNAFYADTLLEVGRGVEARQVFEMLLGRPEVDEVKKAKIRAQLETDPRMKR